MLFLLNYLFAFFNPNGCILKALAYIQIALLCLGLTRHFSCFWADNSSTKVTFSLWPSHKVSFMQGCHIHWLFDFLPLRVCVCVPHLNATDSICLLVKLHIEAQLFAIWALSLSWMDVKFSLWCTLKCVSWELLVANLYILSSCSFLLKFACKAMKLGKRFSDALFLVCFSCFVACQGTCVV